MGSRGAVLSVGGSKNCFVKIPSSWISSVDKNILQVFHIERVEGASLYTTWQGDISPTSDGTDRVEINGLFAAKQGFQDGLEVVVTKVENPPVCERLFVEPLSVDDWEILELHAEYLEQHLLDQLRVAWKGQVIPLWVNNKICIFVRVESVEPVSDCCLLEQMTELHITPKDRQKPVASTPNIDSQNSTVSQASKQTSNTSSLPQNKTPYHSENKGLPSRSSPKGTTEVPQTDVNQEVNDDFFHSLINYFRRLLFGVQSQEGSDSSVPKGDMLGMYAYRKELLPLRNAWTASFRVQPYLDYTTSKMLENGTGNIDHMEIPPVLISNQPTCVFMKYKGFAKLASQLDQTINLHAMPRAFLASIYPSKSPVERDEEMTKKMLNKPPLGTEKKKNGDNLPEESEEVSPTVVRVVLLDSDNSYSLYGPSGLTIAHVKISSKKAPLPNHIIVSDLLRRQISLSVTGRVCLQPLIDTEDTSVRPADIAGLTLHPLFTVPSGFTDEMIILAFKAWIREVTCLDCPLVVSNGTLVKFFLKQDLHGEFLLTMDQVKGNSSASGPLYCLLQCGLCEDLNIKVAPQMTTSNKPKKIQLPAWSIADIDPKLPSVTIQQLGGVKELFEEMKTHLKVSLAVGPLDSHLMSQHRGHRGGALLLYGPKGSGKSTLARAVCRSLAELQTLAHLKIIDCKPLRGKRVDSIQKLLNKAFSEAAWRQPSVILLDDLDHVTAAPSGPEQEMSGEAVYFARVAEVLKDLCHREVMENSAVVVIATCRSRSSLHPTLTASRGHHFSQKVIHINPPDKSQRREMLETLLTFKIGLKDDNVKGLDLVKVAAQTEGHVVRDLEQIVDRALHAHRMASNNKENSHKEIQDADFEAALQGFTPMGLRNVTLHDSGDVTWDSIGGLRDVRRTLIETLQWPSKYPQLFASCPLRLRAGLLLYGAPGTGKTLLAAAVAKECGLNFISIKGPELLSKYIGASEQAVRDTFERAQSAKPCILFFDEFDSLAPRRGHDNTGVTDRVVNQLLTQLDGVEGLEGVYVLAATSRPDLIDPALLRPGRLDKALLCTLPTEMERTEILQVLSRHMSLDDDVNLSKIAALCSYFTGADLKALLYNAQLEAIHETTDLWHGVRDSTVHFKPEEGAKAVLPKDQDQTKTTELVERNPSFECLVSENGDDKRQRNNSSLSEGSSGSDLSAGQSASWEVVTDISEKQATEKQTTVKEKLNKPELAPGSEKLSVEKEGAGDGKLEKPETVLETDQPALDRIHRKSSKEQMTATSRIVAYLPRLEEGVVSVSKGKEEELLNKYIVLDAKAPKKHEGKSVISAICHRHLVEAAQTMQPSVSEKERNKFHQIYENFVGSKGSGLGGLIGEAGQRATLA